MKLQKKLTGYFLLALILVIAPSAFAEEGKLGSRAYLHSYNLDSRGIALEGYDPVSYFTAEKPQVGKRDYRSTYNEVDYYFASNESKARFEQDPEKYIPAYGGWCAFGMAIQDKFPIDPTNFKIVGGRLMLFLRNKNIDALQKWNEGDEFTFVKRAEEHWKKVSG